MARLARRLPLPPAAARCAPPKHCNAAPRAAAAALDPPQVKWGADFLMNSHVADYEYMGSMGNHTEGAWGAGWVYEGQ